MVLALFTQQYNSWTGWMPTFANGVLGWHDLTKWSSSHSILICSRSVALPDVDNTGTYFGIRYQEMPRLYSLSLGYLPHLLSPARLRANVQMDSFPARRSPSISPSMPSSFVTYSCLFFAPMQSSYSKLFVGSFVFFSVTRAGFRNCIRQKKNPSAVPLQPHHTRYLSRGLVRTHSRGNKRVHYM